MYSTSSVAMVDVVATVRKEASDRIAIFMIEMFFFLWTVFSCEMIAVNFMRQGIVANGLQCSLLLFMSMSSCSCSRLVYFMMYLASEAQRHVPLEILKERMLLDCSCVTMSVVPAFPQVSEI